MYMYNNQYNNNKYNKIIEVIIYIYLIKNDNIYLINRNKYM